MSMCMNVICLCIYIYTYVESMSFLASLQDFFTVAHMAANLGLCLILGQSILLFASECRHTEDP